MHSSKPPHDGLDSLSDAEWAEIWSALRLSVREQQIAARIIRGCTDADISNELGISPHTVHTYVERLHRKLETNTRTGLLSRVFASYVDLVRAKDKRDTGDDQSGA